MSTTRAQALLSLQRGRSNLLMMLVLTVVNMVLYFFNATISFPFSAFAPQLAAALGDLWAEDLGLPLLLVAGISLAVLIVGLYGLIFFLSRAYPGWIIAALVMFALDTLLMLFFVLQGEIDISLLIDILFHGWVLYYLVRATLAVVQLRKLPPEEPAPPQAPADALPPSVDP